MIKALLLSAALLQGGALERAEEHMAQGDWDLAAQEAAKAVNGRGGGRAWRIMGEAKRSLGDYAGAAYAFGKAGLEDEAERMERAASAPKASPTPRDTPTAKPTAVPPSPTPSLTATPTWTPSFTSTPSKTATPTATPTWTHSAIPSATAPPTATVPPTPDPKLEQERKALDEERAKLEAEKRELAEERERLSKAAEKAGQPALLPYLPTGGFSLSYGWAEYNYRKHFEQLPRWGGDPGSGGGGGGGGPGPGPGGGCTNCSDDGFKIIEVIGGDLRWRGFTLGVHWTHGEGTYMDTLPGNSYPSNHRLEVFDTHFSLGWNWEFWRARRAPGFGMFLPMALEFNTAELKTDNASYGASNFGALAGLGMRVHLARWLALEGSARFHVPFNQPTFADGAGYELRTQGMTQQLPLETFGPEIRGGFYFPLW